VIKKKYQAGNLWLNWVVRLFSRAEMAFYPVAYSVVHWPDSIMCLKTVLKLKRRVVKLQILHALYSPAQYIELLE
jgi:hypothetical protein